jgi:hypothetical protein
VRVCVSVRAYVHVRVYEPGTALHDRTHKRHLNGTTNIIARVRTHVRMPAKVC